MKRKITLVIIILSLLTTVGLAEANSKLVGKIVAVNSVKDSLLLKTKGEIREYKTALHADIKLNGREVSLSALQPINDSNFQQARIEVNYKGEVEKVNSFYQTSPIKVKKATSNSIVVENLNTKEVNEYSVNTKVELVRNNYSIGLDKLKEGDQGLLILGIKGRPQKIVISNYEPAS
jgi:hypothetical protein